MKLTNEQNIGLSMATMLAHDSYDYDGRPNSISTTGMLKSVRQIVLSKRASDTVATDDEASMDISTLVASSFGSSIHDSIEKVWLSDMNRTRALRKLGFSEAMAERVVVNPGYVENDHGQLVKDPNAEPMADDAIPVYMEIRSEREIDGFIISGKFDFIGDGEIEDHKTTGTYGYMKSAGGIDPKFRQQGSIYRWLNQDIITSDRGLINYTFTDWSKLRSMVEKKKGYPPFRMMTIPYTLMPIQETEDFIKGKLQAIKANIKADEGQLPLCTKEELWQDDTVFSYYKNPNAKERSTKNFTNFAEAQSRLLKDGSVGVIDIRRGEAKHCRYCSGFPICSQSKQLIADGLLDMDK